MSVSCFYSHFFLPKCYQLTRLCSSEEFFKLLLSFTSASNTDIGKQVVHLLLLDGVRFWHRTPPTAKSLFPAEAHNPISQRGGRGEQSGRKGQKSPYRVWAVGKCSPSLTLSHPREGSGLCHPHVQTDLQLTCSCISSDSLISRGRSS